MNAFQEYAKYYDLFYQDKDYDLEVDYVDKLINRYFGCADFILDLGCGTGKHAALLDQKGYFVHGVDISKEMIAQAKDNFRRLSKLNFSCGDVRTIDLNQKFDVVLSLFHVFSYQVTNQDLKKAFLTVAKHLYSNGIFIFDCWYGPAVLKHKPAERLKRIENKEMVLTRLAQPVIYPSDNLVDVHYDIDFFNKNSGEKGKIKETHKMRYLFDSEIKSFLNESGLSLLSCEEWVTGKKATSDSWSVCFVCKKK